MSVSYPKMSQSCIESSSKVVIGKVNEPMASRGTRLLTRALGHTRALGLQRWPLELLESPPQYTLLLDVRLAG